MKEKTEIYSAARGGYSKMMEKLYFDLSSLPQKRELSLTLGNFDGFHLGHQKLAYEAFSNSTKENAILFFSASYRNFYFSEPSLTDLSQRLILAEQNRYESAYILSATKELFELSCEEFEELLLKLGAKEIFVGEDYRYGKGALGTPEKLSKQGFKVHIVPLYLDNGEKVASTRIKRLIQEGEMEEAARLLGRPYEMIGKVIKGRGVGKTLGFPTANLDCLIPYETPFHGAYAGRVLIRGVPRLAMISVGSNPTFEGEKTMIEAHILDFDSDIYGETIYVSFYHLLRPVTRFANKEALIAQLRKDEEAAKAYFLDLQES